MKKILVSGLMICCMAGMSQTFAEEQQPTVVDIKRMSMDVALRLAKAAIEQCRKEGVQVAVTVVDRGGHPQVVLRDVLAQDLTLTISRMKAYTAMSFNMDTSAMEGRFTSPFSIGKVEGIVVSAGGVPITASGNILGGVGVSGAPSGKTDEKCAKAGVSAVIDDLEMATM
ncbi:GlcG/HbpS family heme-binding protein [Kaarinaea lacus]